MKTVKKIIRENVIRILWYFPKDIAHKITYRLSTGKKLDLKNPKDLNQKVRYLLLKEFGEKETQCADKYRVREYVISKGYEEILPKLYGVYDDPRKIEFDSLPDQYVLKTNHGCGCTILCIDKTKIDKNKIIKSLNKSLKENYARAELEYQYNDIKPLVLCEEYINDKVNMFPNDYKIFCCNGKPECIRLGTNRDKMLKQSYYDLEWEYLDYTKEQVKERYEKPKELDKMLKIASKLSEDFKFVRVDLYNIDGKVYFGELTFTPSAGMNKLMKQEALDYLGEKISL